MLKSQQCMLQGALLLAHACKSACSQHSACSDPRLAWKSLCVTKAMLLVRLDATACDTQMYCAAVTAHNPELAAVQTVAAAPKLEVVMVGRAEQESEPEHGQSLSHSLSLRASTHRWHQGQPCSGAASTL